MTERPPGVTEPHPGVTERPPGVTERSPRVTGRSPRVTERSPRVTEPYTNAMASISTSAPRGRPATCTVARAGGETVK